MMLMRLCEEQRQASSSGLLEPPAPFSHLSGRDEPGASSNLPTIGSSEVPRPRAHRAGASLRGDAASSTVGAGRLWLSLSGAGREAEVAPVPNGGAYWCPLGALSVQWLRPGGCISQHDRTQRLLMRPTNSTADTPRRCSRCSRCSLFPSHLCARWNPIAGQLYLT